MDFVEVRFPTDIAYGASGGGVFNTDITTSYTGYEQRNINWDKAKASYTISLANKSKTEIQNVIAFFYARHGKAVGFRFKDWMDFEAENQYIGTGDNIKKQFQLVKIYESGGIEYKRTITKPVRDTVKIYINNILLEEELDYTLNYTTGIITFDDNNIPTNNDLITADFEFDVPVRFDSDELNISTTDLNANTWSSIKLVEIRV